MPAHETFTIKKEDARYPELLRHIADPPERLYCRGNVALLNTFCMGIVGTRKASDYGRQAAADIAGTLARRGITVVSGLAAGIDAVAHRAALDAGGSTIAVFGTGVDDASIFPSPNIPLAHRVMDEGGLALSEYAVGTPGQRWTFPMRNRIISGLSRGVIVVEADRESGSLITAKCALDQDRDVFAVPGSIYWPRSVGANLLIQQGARPVLTAGDVLDFYGLVPENGSPRLSTSDPVQQRILALLEQNGPMHLDALAAGCDNAAGAMAAVAMLELDGTIRHQGSGTYALCISSS